MKKSDGTEVEISKVAIPKEPTRYERDGSLVEAIKECLVITTSGQVWGVEVLDFHASEEIIRRIWKDRPEDFKKREQ